MLADSPAYSGFSVDDLAAARSFYADTLGLAVTEQNGMLHLRTPGDRDTLIYPSQSHRPASYTVLNFPVPDIDAVVDQLVDRGVHVERYPGMPQDQKGILRGRSVGRGPDIAWFTDPAGNVLSVLQSD